MTGGWSDLNGQVTTAGGGSSSALSVALIEDVKAQNTNGGSFVTGAARTRALNTVSYDPDGIVVGLSSDQFQLDPGIYLIEWSAPAVQCNSHQSWLQNITLGTVAKRGSTEISSAGTAVQSNSIGSYYAEIESTTAFEIRHSCSVTANTWGFGIAGNFGAEIYTQVRITRLGDIPEE